MPFIARGSLASVDFPTDVYERIKAFTKQTHTTISQFIRDAAITKLKACEEELRQDAAQKEAELDARRVKRKGGIKTVGRPPARLGTLPGLAPIRIPEKNLDGSQTSIPKTKLAEVYNDYARKILDAGDDQASIKRLGDEAIRVVKKISPLLHPPEREILLLLENTVFRLREALGYDDLVGKSFDPSRIRTRGDAIPTTEDEFETENEDT